MDSTLTESRQQTWASKRKSGLAKDVERLHAVGVTTAHWSIMSTAYSSSRADALEPPPRRCPDLDVRDLEQRTRLMRIVTRLIAVSDLGSREIARRAGIPIQKISDLLSGKLEHFTYDELQAIRRIIDSGQASPA
ncbi:helix-turn-helix domain-containing protein [Halomonas cupida]|nr:XRE family transcriptional regulator [Halomonas cupida]